MKRTCYASRDRLEQICVELKRMAETPHAFTVSEDRVSRKLGYCKLCATKQANGVHAVKMTVDIMQGID